MKILVVGLDRVSPDRLLGDDRLDNLRRLMDAGTFGLLVGATSGDYESFRDDLVREEWAVARLVELGPEFDDARTLDEAVGGLLDALDGDTIILVVGREGAVAGAFILAGPGLPALGPVDGAHLGDFAPALRGLSSGGTPVPLRDGSPLEALASAELVAFGGAEEDEELVRERLRGLGYIG
jgi:hypothetical protein